MSGIFSLFPSFIFKDLDDITPEFISQQGIRFVMIDLDNTVASYKEDAPAESVLQWFVKLRASGIKLFLISNSKKQERVESFATALETGFVMDAHKPLPKRLHRVMGMAGFDIGECALIGDQIFTDVLAANLAGIVSILIHPRCFTNPLLALRYIFELPFRTCCTKERSLKKH